MPAVRRYSKVPLSFPNSSDTEQPTTPTRKRYRDFDLESPSSISSFGSPSKRARREPPKKKEFDLEDMLRNCLAKPYDHDAILALRDLPRDEQSVSVMVQTVISTAKGAVQRRFSKSRGKLLETELYYQWLKELDYLLSAIETALNSKQPGTRRKTYGLGRICYTILYNFIDHFTSEVNAHHDGWSIPPSRSPSKTLLITMTLMEESSDPTADDRSEKAVHLAEVSLKNIDRIMAIAVRRYKSESGRNNMSLASKIGVQEHLLAKSCCLLCEQTGYGGDDDDMGDSLLQETREIMSEWRREYDNDEEDQLVDSDVEQE